VGAAGAADPWGFANEIGSAPGGRPVQTAPDQDVAALPRFVGIGDEGYSVNAAIRADRPAQFSTARR
jgi:hypothetical protein